MLGVCIFVLWYAANLFLVCDLEEKAVGRSVHMTLFIDAFARFSRWIPFVVSAADRWGLRAFAHVRTGAVSHVFLSISFVFRPFCAIFAPKLWIH